VRAGLLGDDTDTAVIRPSELLESLELDEDTAE
jgi:hypothetical protein